MKKSTQKNIKDGDILYFTCPSDLTEGILYTKFTATKDSEGNLGSGTETHKSYIKNYDACSLHYSKHGSLKRSQRIIDCRQYNITQETKDRVAKKLEKYSIFEEDSK